MAATRRLKKELLELREMGLTNFRKLQVDEDNNILLWQGLIVPDNPPYNKGAFKIEINFPVDYPFRPPKLFFHTPIYHPNIDEQGHVCLPILMTDFWRPATRMVQVITAIVALVSNPDPFYALRNDAAEELLKDRRKFMITAEAHTVQHALPRPKELAPPPVTPAPPLSGSQSNAPNPPPSGSQSSAPNPPPSGSQSSAPNPPPSGSQSNAPSSPPSGSQSKAPNPPPSGSQSSATTPPPSGSQSSATTPPPSGSQSSAPNPLPSDSQSKQPNPPPSGSQISAPQSGSKSSKSPSS